MRFTWVDLERIPDPRRVGVLGKWWWLLLIVVLWAVIALPVLWALGVI